MDGLQTLLTRSADALSNGNIKEAYYGYLDILDAAAVELRKIKFINNVAITSITTATLISATKSSVASVQDILARQNPTIAAVSSPQPTSPTFRTTPSYRKPSLARHSERISMGQVRTVTMLTEQIQAAAAAAAAGTSTNTTLTAATAATAPALAPIPEPTVPADAPVTAPASAPTFVSISTPPSVPITGSVSLPTSTSPSTTTISIPVSASASEASSASPSATATESTSPPASESISSHISTFISIQEQASTPSSEPTAPTAPATPPAPRTASATTNADNDEETAASSAEQQRNKDESMSPSIHSPPSPFSSPDTSSPAIYSPLLRSANVTIPTKPTRRPPPSPYSDTPSMDTIDTSRQIRGSIDSPMQLSYPPNTPLECGGHPDLNSPPLMRPPKPVRYNRKAPETRNSEDLSLDDDSSDDEVEVEEEEEEEEEDQDVQQEGAPLSHMLQRKTSSPNIAIPQLWRRHGPSVSVPASPTHSPPSIHSSCPSSQSTRSLSHTQYSLLRQNSNGLVAVIPEGCVDPSNLVEAERINGDQEDELDQKTYSPSDHLPTIPISPLKTTHRSLLEKEKSWTSMLADTKYRIQELYAQYPLQDDTSEAAEQKRCKDDREIMTLEDDACKYTSQISNIMATITKVRELLYRSAGITSILEFPPYLIAYQLTLIESAIFLEIPPAALLTHAPKTPHGSITASTDFFNYLTRMIEYSVLFPAEASGRAQIINHWVKVAVKLHELENFQTLKAVLCALGTPPIKRLKRTWGFLPRKSTSKIEMLSDLMSEDRNYGKYREMMNSLWAGTLLPSPEVSSPVLSDSVSGSRFDILGGWSSPEVKSKEAARRPVIPFLGTFIMDMTYLLAAVKKSNATSAAPSPSTKIPATSSLRERNLTVNTTFCPEDDVRIQDLLLTLTAYQSGPRYSPQPPRSYIKASTKTQHHFRAPSLSSALQMTTKYRNNNNAADRDRDRQFIFDDEDDDFLGGTGAVSGGIRSTQQLILHYILTRPWAPEKMVDELSMIREPNKNNSNNSSKGHGIGGGSWSNSAGSLSSWSGTGSMYSHSSTISTDAHTSMASSEGSRPTSMEDE